MANLRKEARGMPCMVRLPGCDGGGETTVLAHYRMVNTGIGKKPDDEQAAWACFNCHERIDQRINSGLPRVELRLAHAEAVLRTQYARRHGVKL